RSAPPLLDLRKQGSGAEARRDAPDGSLPAVAGRPRGDQRKARDGRDRDPRLLRAAPEVAGRAEPRQTHRLVGLAVIPRSESDEESGPRSGWSESVRHAERQHRVEAIRVEVVLDLPALGLEVLRE